MARLAKRMREALPPVGIRPGRLRIGGSGDVGKRAGLESARTTKPQPPCLSPPARGTQEVSLRRGNFFAVDVSGLGSRIETPAGPAGGNPRPPGPRSNDREEPYSLRGSRFSGLARENRGRTICTASPVSSPNGGKNISAAGLARRTTGRERFAIHGTRAAREMGFVRHTRFSPRAPGGAVVLAIVRWPSELRPRRKGIADRRAIDPARRRTASGNRTFQEGQGLPQGILPDDPQDFAASGLDEEGS